MKFLILYLLLILECDFTNFAQSETGSNNKTLLDTVVFDKWPFVYSPSISNNGAYASWFVRNQPVGNQTFIVKGLKNNWEREFLGIDNPLFTDDSHRLIFIKSKDTLCLYTLGTDSVEYIPKVESFKLFKRDKEEWLAFQLESNKSELIFKNLATGSIKLFEGVNQYWQDKSANVLIIKMSSNKDIQKKTSLSYIKFPDGLPITFWEGLDVSKIVFDEVGEQMAFIVTELLSAKMEKSFWRYKQNSDSAVMIANNQTFGIEKELKLDEIISFTKDGKGLFVKLKEKDFPKANPDGVNVDVWSYLDTKLQSQQLDELKPVSFDIFGGHGPQSYLAVLNFGDKKICRLQYENEKIRLQEPFLVITKRNGGDKHEWNWNPASKPFFYLSDTRIGNRKLLEKIKFPEFSPCGKYLIGSDLIEEGRNIDLICYNLFTGRFINLTENINIPKDIMDSRGSNRSYRDFNVAVWLSNDTALLVYDRFDLWKLDPDGKRKPENMTNGYGRKHNITFSLIPMFPENPLNHSIPIILSAFDHGSKKNGFYLFSNGPKKDPEILTMENFLFYAPKENLGNCPIKARDSFSYLICRESASQSPNYFWTSDFKKFNSLSSLYPEQKYNWLKSELISYFTLDGIRNQGILYKPENFDFRKKYPVVIHYYEKMSQFLNKHYVPNAFGDEINIPWLVSQGYIVFTPDIIYKVGFPGQSAYNSIVAAANYLKKYSWIDPHKIGIQGHSFGGFETNYIVSHTKMFAAAMSSSGICDFISHYGAVMKGQPQFGLQFLYEVDQSRIEATIWERPNLFLENSPILFADKVETPILLMNNKDDGIVPFSQGVEFFTALRRLKKRVWMLQYDGERHSLTQKKSKIDFTIRVTQFFNHYLKDLPAPVWMQKGIPAKMKGILNGLEIE